MKNTKAPTTKSIKAFLSSIGLEYFRTLKSTSRSCKVMVHDMWDEAELALIKHGAVLLESKTCLYTTTKQFVLQGKGFVKVTGWDRGDDGDFYSNLEIKNDAKALAAGNRNTHNVETLLKALNEIGVGLVSLSNGVSLVKTLPTTDNKEMRMLMKQVLKTSGWKSQGKGLFPDAENSYFFRAKGERSSQDSQACLDLRLSEFCIFEEGNW